MVDFAQTRAFGWGICCAVLVWAGCHCEGTPPPTNTDGDAEDSGVQVDAGNSETLAFPEAPILDNAPAQSAMLFGAFDSDGGTSPAPCLLEPEPGSLFPRDWLRPRFSVVPAEGQNLFEWRVRAPRQAHELVVYTSSSHWTLPKEYWTVLTTQNLEEAIEYTVRGAGWDGTQLTQAPSLVATGQFSIAPASASGTIIYWTSSSGTKLKGFLVGADTSQQVLAPGQAGTQCVGCHSSTPDGLYAAFSKAKDSTDGTIASFGLLSVNGQATEPPFLTASSKELLARESQQAPVFSAGHWQQGDRVGISVMALTGWQLIWTDLEAASTAEGMGWGVLDRTGDTKSASSPSFSHDGTRIAYVSASDVVAGMIQDNGGGDIRLIPYANRAGGTSVALEGAATTEHNEFYPVFSPDDSLVAFNRVPEPGSSYNNPNAEVYVVSASGGTPHRVVANDPPVCAGTTSPGITNSWPRWAPAATSVETTPAGTKTYYWLAFSSTRYAGLPQIFVSPIVVENGTVQSFPALYLWNQTQTEGNHTPAWDLFQIPM